MRRTHNAKWIFSKEGSTDVVDLMGIGMGSDMCAEHECGVPRMQQELACDGKKDGIERRRIGTVPEELQLVSGRKYDAIFFYRDYLTSPPVQERIKQRIKRDFALSKYPGSSPLLVAWDETSFGIVAYGKKADADRAYVRALGEAFQRKDIALWTDVGVFHLGMGLMFVIVSKVPDNLKQTMLDNDLSQKRLAQRVVETGIEADLTKAGKRWFSLSPRWADDKETDVKFWLNPMEQRQYNAGWWSVEELRQWARDTGPVIKTAKAAQ